MIKFYTEEFMKLMDKWGNGNGLKEDAPLIARYAYLKDKAQESVSIVKPKEGTKDYDIELYLWKFEKAISDMELRPFLLRDDKTNVVVKGLDECASQEEIDNFEKLKKQFPNCFMKELTYPKKQKWEGKIKIFEENNNN